MDLCACFLLSFVSVWMCWLRICLSGCLHTAWANYIVPVFQNITVLYPAAQNSKLKRISLVSSLGFHSSPETQYSDSLGQRITYWTKSIQKKMATTFYWALRLSILSKIPLSFRFSADWVRRRIIQFQFSVNSWYIEQLVKPWQPFWWTHASTYEKPIFSLFSRKKIEPSSPNQT